MPLVTLMIQWHFNSNEPMIRNRFGFVCLFFVLNTPMIFAAIVKSHDNSQ
jgi:hypothetical protein